MRNILFNFKFNEKYNTAMRDSSIQFAGLRHVHAASHDTATFNANVSEN